MTVEMLAIWLIAVFLIMIMFSAMAKPFKIAGNIFINAIIGLSTLFSANMLLASSGAAVGINAYTAAISAILGFPGTLLLYGIKLFMKF